MHSFVERRVLLPGQQFLQAETTGAAVLLFFALFALAWANSPWSDAYHRLFEDATVGVDLGFLEVRENLRHWINDGLMVVFFFVVGLEVKRELAYGELSTPKRAALPMIAAVGGILVPALIYLAMNRGGEGAQGWGIPIATDIAFALGALALAGKGLPNQARTFLLALAAVDDIGAILVIAVFYSSSISLPILAGGAAVLAGIWGLRAIGVMDVKLYFMAGLILWFTILQSGVHATVVGIALGLLTPSRPPFEMEHLRKELGALVSRFRKALSDGDREEAEVLLGRIEMFAADTEAPLDRRLRNTHPWSSKLVLPLFALANAGVQINSETVSESVNNAVTYGIVGGLVAGKFAGIVGFSLAAVKLGIADLPQDVNWKHVAGMAFLAGIGFTMSLFVAGLAFEGTAQIEPAKLGILAASVIAGIIGAVVLRLQASN